MTRRDVMDLEDEFPRPFGRYLLVDALGKGGMGEVFLAKHKSHDGHTELCVVKKLRADLVKDREYVTRFVDEANVVVTLNHPNICHVFDVGKNPGGEYFLGMEYLSGIDAKLLSDRAAERGQGVPTAAVLQIGLDVLAALDYAHKVRHPRTGEPLELIHRDVSPHNVVVGFDAQSKLIDFGLASSRLKIEQTAPNVVMGKMAYMGPEQARGDAIDARADQFAVSMVLYELLVGERFYEGLTANEIWNTVGRGGFRPRKWKTIPRGLRNILDKALHKDFRKRYADCDALRIALAQHLTNNYDVSGEDALHAAIADLAGDMLQEEWGRLAELHEIGMSGFTQQLEQTGRLAQVIAQSDPANRPSRASLPAPRPIEPGAETHLGLPQLSTPSDASRAQPRASKPSGAAPAVAEPRTISGLTPTPMVGGKSVGISAEQEDEETYLVARKRGNIETEPTQFVRDRSASGEGVPPSDMTERVRDGRPPADGGVVQAGVVVVQPSEAHAAASAALSPAVIALGGLALVVLLVLGGVIGFILTSDESTSVAKAEPAPEEPGNDDDEATEGSGQEPAAAVTGRKKVEDDELPSGDAPADDGDEAQAEEDAQPKVKKINNRRKKAAERRSAERERARMASEKKRIQREAAEAVAKAKEAAARKKADEDRDAEAEAKAASRKSLARGKRELKKKGYTSDQAWPSEVKTAYAEAKGDLTDAKAAEKFHTLAKMAPTKKPKSSGSSKLSTEKRIRNLKKCIKKRQCAKDLFTKLPSIAGKKLPANREIKLRKQVAECETLCSL